MIAGSYLKYIFRLQNPVVKAVWKPIQTIGSDVFVLYLKLPKATQGFESFFYIRFEGYSECRVNGIVVFDRIQDFNSGLRGYFNSNHAFLSLFVSISDFSVSQAINSSGRVFESR